VRARLPVAVDEHARASDEARAQANYDPHTCEFCGERLPDPGPAFLQHLDESDTCRWLWLAHRPLVQNEAGGS